MVDFNRWLAEVLDDTRSEGIEWGPSYGESPWLALEEPQPQDGPYIEAFSTDDDSTFRLLRTACEYYMTRCKGLQQTNADLTTQLDEAQVKLKEALVRAFELQQTLEREREVSMLHAERIVMGVQIGDHLSRQNSHGQCPTSLHQQITDAFRMLNTISGDSVEGTETESTLVSEEEVEESHPNEPESEAVLQTAHVGAVARSATLDDCDYRQLTELHAGDETSGSWYQHALRSLKEKREQRRVSSKTESAIVTPLTAIVDLKETSSDDVKEFVQLVSIRDPAEDGEDLTWYRRALQHLKDERRRRVSLQDRDSFTSTISIVD
ncbi:hypothetical protein GN244_ATG14922 [Phytophthora infestans]|nr:hypothetical protein GN244_ATG14922 [Phytophthora infestans]